MQPLVDHVYAVRAVLVQAHLRCSEQAMYSASRLCLQVQRFEGGERQRYFADDDKRSLDDLVREQRYEGAANTDSNMADNIMRKGKRFRCMELCARSWFRDSALGK